VGLVSTVLIALAPGCKKEPGPPSPEYEQAQQRFSKIYAQKLDDAYLDPAMDDILGLLAQVPAESMDAPSAKELEQRIKGGRAKKEKEQKEQEEAIAKAQEGDVVPPSPTTETEPEPSPPPKDAGPTGDQGPVAGSLASELSSGYLGCFQSIKPINVEGRGMRDAWEMADRARCQQVYPNFKNQVLLIEDAKVLAVLPKSAVTPTFLLPDGGTTTGKPGGQ
jgi:hypothetical protein